MIHHTLVHLLLFLSHLHAFVLLKPTRMWMWIPGLVLLCCGLMAKAGQNITLGWNATTNASVAGYVICYGAVNQKYIIRRDVGTNLNVTITNLQPGQTYFFAVGNYNSAQVESTLSGKLYYLVPGALQISAQTNASGGLKNISFPVAPTHWYELQGSTNLQAWTTVWQTAVCTSNVWSQYTDPQSALMPKRFYRLILH